MKAAGNKPAHLVRGNVLDDLRFSPDQATALKFKAELYQAILKVAKKHSQKELQIILGEPQPRVSKLLNWFPCRARFSPDCPAHFVSARKSPCPKIPARLYGPPAEV